MIAYLDSSSLVKLVVSEPESAEVDAVVRSASYVTSSRIAYPEVASAIARRHRASELDDATTRELMERLERRWSTIVILEFDEREAGRLSQVHPLRGADAIHVACAVALANTAGSAAVRFVSYDARQIEAAVAEGLSTVS